MELLHWLLLIVICFVTGAFSSTVAKLKGYNAENWYAAGFFFSIIGLLAAIGLPEKKADNPKREPVSE